VAPSLKALKPREPRLELVVDERHLVGVHRRPQAAGRQVELAAAVGGESAVAAEPPEGRASLVPLGAEQFAGVQEVHR
jgi:hypothetical protein